MVAPTLGSGCRGSSSLMAGGLRLRSARQCARQGRRHQPGVAGRHAVRAAAAHGRPATALHRLVQCPKCSRPVLDMQGRVPAADCVYTFCKGCSSQLVRDPAEREGESRRPWRLEIPEHEDIRSVTSLVPLAARSAQLPTDGEINAVGKTSVTAPPIAASRAVRGGTAFKRQSHTWLYRGPLRGLRIPVAVLREPRYTRGSQLSGACG
jgi:hypothetical protein